MLHLIAMAFALPLVYGLACLIGEAIVAILEAWADDKTKK